MDDCQTLKNVIESLIKKGYLDRYVQEETSREPQQQVQAVRNTKQNLPIRVVYVILRGKSMVGDSSNAKKDMPGRYFLPHQAYNDLLPLRRLYTSQMSISRKMYYTPMTIRSSSQCPSNKLSLRELWGISDPKSVSSHQTPSKRQALTLVSSGRLSRPSPVFHKPRRSNQKALWF